jgi:hypothetical protein
MERMGLSTLWNVKLSHVLLVLGAVEQPSPTPTDFLEEVAMCALVGEEGIFHKQQGSPSAAAPLLYLKVISSMGGDKNTPIQPLQSCVLTK